MTKKSDPDGIRTRRKRHVADDCSKAPEDLRMTNGNRVEPTGPCWTKNKRSYQLPETSVVRREHRQTCHPAPHSRRCRHSHVGLRAPSIYAEQSPPIGDTSGSMCRLASPRPSPAYCHSTTSSSVHASRPFIGISAVYAGF